MENVHIIDKEMVEGLKQMFLGNDQSNIPIAMAILDNRDKTSQESESNYNEFIKLIVDDNVLFPRNGLWVVKCGGRILQCNGKAGFKTEVDAKSNLSRHLTSHIGANKDKIPYQLQNPNQYSYQGINYNYFRAIKQIFGTGINMRNFLIKHGILTVEKID